MVKELQRKFVKTTMILVTILLALFIAALNISYYVLSRRASLNSLESAARSSLTRMPGIFGTSGLAPDDYRVSGDDMPDDDIQGNYFSAMVNSEGTIVFYDLTHDSSLSFDDMVSLLQKTDDDFGIEITGETESETDISAHKESPGGLQPPEYENNVTDSVNGYLYSAFQTEDGSVVYVFLDVSQERASMALIMLITVTVGAAAWGLILLLAIYLSRRAISPIAENIERQRRFITDAGHEIKTPLAVIISNVDVQELHGGKTKWLDNIRTQAMRLSDLTKQMLTLSKMDESVNRAFTSITFDASSALQDTVRVFNESASLRGIKIKTQIEPGVKITFPKEQYQQMLELLLDNAVKYASQDSDISVSLRSDRRSVKIGFGNECDELPDIDPDRLFDRFYRADTSRSRQSGGSGIGLAVVRAIAENSGGKANAYFHDGNEIEFVITIPKTRQPHPKQKPGHIV